MQTQATPASGKRTPKMPGTKTLLNSAVWFQLHDDTMTNEAIAHHLGAVVCDEAPRGMQGAVIYRDGAILGIRVNEREVAIFLLFQSALAGMERIADRINMDRRNVTVTLPGNCTKTDLVELLKMGALAMRDPSKISAGSMRSGAMAIEAMAAGIT
ncbi:MAG TPA: hypothetical protein VMH91_02880 [Candidatus Paceibacterota bacterium]|nr:hypothetical protein [Candidatus Paceibacterota bacterium]